MNKLVFCCVTTIALSALSLTLSVHSFAKPSKEQIAFGEWSKALYETQSAAEKMGRFERGNWFFSEWPKREGKIIRKYHVEPWQFHEEMIRGISENWPTEKPEHREAAKRVLLFRILQDRQKLPTYQAGNVQSQG